MQTHFKFMCKAEIEKYNVLSIRSSFGNTKKNDWTTAFVFVVRKERGLFEKHMKVAKQANKKPQTTNCIGRR